MTEKKVILFIVEGPSEEAALGSIMKEYFSSSTIQFVVVHGDITLNDYARVDTIVKKISHLIDQVLGRYRYHSEDVLKIIHITDTDGVFIPKEAIWERDVESVRYFEDHIETDHVTAAIKRSEKKAEILFKLRKTGKIHGIYYRIYFNSCNLEHVLYGELREYTDEEKQRLSDEFAELYEGNPESFVDYISSEEIAVPGTYQKTWDYIERDLNSLHRHSNMDQIFRKA